MWIYPPTTRVYLIKSEVMRCTNLFMSAPWVLTKLSPLCAFRNLARSPLALEKKNTEQHSVCGILRSHRECPLFRHVPNSKVQYGGRTKCPLWRGPNTTILFRGSFFRGTHSVCIVWCKSILIHPSLFPPIYLYRENYISLRRLSHMLV